MTFDLKANTKIEHQWEDKKQKSTKSHSLKTIQQNNVNKEELLSSEEF